MINEQLLQYIKSQREAGTSDEEIKENLSAAGWRDEDIAEGFEAVSGADKSTPQSHQEVRQEAAQDRQDSQATQKSDTASQQGSQSQAQPDQYRESVNEKQQSKAASKKDGQPKQTPNTSADQQQPQSGSKADNTPNNQRHAANEEPQELRTMEEDKKRFSDQDQKDEQNKQQAQPKQSKHPESSQKKGGAEQKQPESKKQTKTEKEKPQNRKEDSSDGYSPTQANHKQQEQKTEQKRKQQSQSQPQKAGPQQPNQSSSRPQSSQKPTSRSAAQRKQKQRKSKIQKARQQSSSTSISAIILSILGLILLGGGAAYAYLNYFQGPTAQTSAQEVMQALADAETFEYRIGVGRQAEDNSTTEETVVIEGAVNLTSEGDSYYTIRRPSQPGGSPVTGIASEFSEFSNLDPRQQQTISQTLLQPEFFTVREFQTQQQLGATENSSGFQTNRFGVMANPGQLTSAYNTIHEAIYGESVSSPIWSTLEQELGGFEPQQGQLWVHPTSSVPYQMTFIGTGSSGENLQVNMMFRDFGDEISSAPRTYESRPVVSGLADAFGASNSDDTTDLANNGQSTSTNSTTTNPGGQQATSTTDGSDTANNNNQQEQTQRQDRLRINDLQQLQVALRSYANENGSYPANLNELASSQGNILSALPTDPQTNSPYAYAVNQAQTVYHLGATLEVISGQQAPDDADYNSTAGSFSGGFDGSQSVCRAQSQLSGSTCYDLRGIVSPPAN